MLKKTVEYTDFDDNAAVETLYFNLTKTDLADNMHIIEEFESLSTMLSGAKRDLTTAEVQQVLNMVKKVMEISYGIRSADGKRFAKTEQQWVEFTQTAVYDTFLISLFENPQNAVDFVTGIIPKDIREEAVAKAKAATELTEMAQRTVKKADDLLEARYGDAAPVVLPADVTAAAAAPAPFGNTALTAEQLEAATQDYMRRNNLQ